MVKVKYLQWCPNCKEGSVKVKIYKKVKRVEYCINKGCRYKLDLPDLYDPNNPDHERR